MRLTFTALKRKHTVELKLRNFLFQVPGFQFSTYFASISDKGWLVWWPQASQYYKRGFVFRCLWFGLIIRQGAVKVKKVRTPLWWAGDGEEVF